MRTSHREIKRRINEEKSKVTDTELFLSKAFAAYLTDMAEAVTKRYKRSIKVVTYMDEDVNASIAYTDNRCIYINVGNYLTKTFPTRLLRADSLIGLHAHEIGHILFTDFEQTKIYFHAMTEGRLYPAVPTDLEAEEEESLHQLQDKLLHGTKAESRVIMRLAKELLNILEDCYIEQRLCIQYPGKFAIGIYLNNLRFAEIVHPIEKQVEKGNLKFAILANLLVQYCTGGDINNRDEQENEVLDRFYEILPFVDSAVYDDDMRSRFDAVNRILLHIWDYVLEMLNVPLKEEDIHSGTASVDGEALDEVLKQLEEQIVRTAVAPMGEDVPVSAALPKGLEEIENALREKKAELGKLLQMNPYIPLELTDEISEGEDGGVTFEEDYEGLNEVQAAEDINRILTELAEEKVMEHEERELSKELREGAGKIRLGNAHKGVRIKIKRIAVVPEAYKERYEMVAPPMLQLSKQIQKRLRRIQKDTVNKGKVSALLMGRRIEPRLLLDKECRFFSRNIAPTEEKDMAVALLIDESGSMCYADRATYARASGIIIYDFCHAMGIPLLIMGHTEDDDVELYAYTDFRSRDANDRYRLMDISARDGNRDGAALRYVAERLMQQPEKTKLLLLISDGQPAGNGYHGTEAEADLRGIKKEFTNKGMIFVAAAIGADKENIERIYGDAYLDITDLNKLPYLLVKRIEREMRG